jgi:hypothetical protein
MFRVAPLIVMLTLLSTGCAVATTHERAARWVVSDRAARDSMGRCDYAVEGALGLPAGVTVLTLVRGHPAEQLAFTVPISAGLGWLWGRFLMPPRPRCRRSDSEKPDTTNVQTEIQDSGA